MQAAIPWDIQVGVAASRWVHTGVEVTRPIGMSGLLRNWRININLDVWKITICTAIKEDRQYSYIKFNGNVYRVFFIGCSYIIHSIFIFLEICYVMVLSNLNRIFIYEACVSKHQRTKIQIWPNFSFQNHESLKTLKKEWKWLIFTTEGENGKLFIGVPFGVRASNKESFPFPRSLSMSSGLISVRITPCSNSTMSLGCSL